MRTQVFVLLAFAGMVLFSCKQNESKKEDEKDVTQTAVTQQQQDGTISLAVDKADKYQDTQNPESNTAEWNVLVSKSGRYNVWLSSATKDTTKLAFNSAVLLSVKDDRLEARPSVDKVIHNSSDVSYPYYRAESFLGSLFLQDTGVYSIQLISDKIVPEGQNGDNAADDTRLLSVSLTPVTN